MVEPMDFQSESYQPTYLLSTPEKSPLNCNFNVGVRRCRAVIVSVLTAIGLVCAMLPFARDGVQVDSFRSTDKTPAEQKALLDKYNSISGSLAVLLAKPLDVMLSMIVTVTLLCVATEFQLRHDARTRYFTMGLLALVGYMLNTGFSTLNVQVVSGTIDPRIISSDLTVGTTFIDNQPLDSNGFLTTTMDKAFRESAPGNSVYNTILRNFFVATEEVPFWCNRSDDFPDPFKNVIASYGFPSRSWQKRALSRALEPTASMRMSMNAAANDLPLDTDLPMSESIATNLAVYALLLSNTFLGWWGDDGSEWQPPHPYGSSKTLAVAEYFNLTARSSTNATLVSDIHKRIVDYYSKAENASITDELAMIEFTRVNLTDTVTFDALTIEIPTQKFGAQNDNSSSTNPFYGTLGRCIPSMCFIGDEFTLPFSEYLYDGTKTTISPRVQALAICLNAGGGEELVADFGYYWPRDLLQKCDQRSNTSMIVVSIGKRVEGDEFKTYSSDSSQHAQVTNARMVYSFTVGRLSWLPENLSDVYGAECASDEGCFGIRFPLEKEATKSDGDVLLVSASGISMAQLSPINLNRNWFTQGASHWKLLASTVEEPRGGALTTETRIQPIVLPRNFKTIDPHFTTYMENNGLGTCEILIDKYLTHMEKNHLYIEQSLQPAYTAGFYFILQNAVVLKHLNSSVVSVSASLEFSGNIQNLQVRASIPTTNLILAVVSCIAMAFGGIIIALMARKGEREFLAHANAGETAEALTNLEKFPPFLLRLELRNSETGGIVKCCLDSLQVVSLVLDDVADETQQIVVGQGQQSVTVTSSV